MTPLTAPIPPVSSDIVTVEQQVAAVQRTCQLHERYELRLSHEIQRTPRAGSLDAQLPPEVRAARRIDRKHPSLSGADRTALAIAGRAGDQRAAQLLLLTESTLACVTTVERSRSIERTAQLHRRYRHRLTAEHDRGPRARDEDMLYPAQIRAATHLDGTNQYLQKEDQRLLVIAAKLGDSRATTLLLMSNQHAAIKTAKRVLRKDNSLHDMVQSTNLGLLHAIHLYDPHNERDAAFLTFAGWHGWQRAMRDGQMSGRTGLSVPPYMDQICDLIRKVRLELMQCQQREERDMDELLELVNEGRSLKNLIEAEELQRAVVLLMVSYQPLDAGWANEEDDSRSLSEQIGFDSTADVIDDIDAANARKALRTWLRGLLGSDYELYIKNQGLFGHQQHAISDLHDELLLSGAAVTRNQVARRVRDAKKLVAERIESGTVNLTAPTEIVSLV